MIFQKWFKKEQAPTPESPVPGCKHDWEVVNEVSLEEVLESIPGTTNVDITIHYSNFVSLWYHDAYMNLSLPRTTKYSFERKVCLECGVCIDQSRPAKQMWEERLAGELNKRREKDSRKRLAKRMWRQCDET